MPEGRVLSPAEQAVVSEAKRRFGGALLVEPYQGKARLKACRWQSLVGFTLWTCDPPMRAGLAMVNSGAACTTGFLARSRSDGKLFVMSAGHCADLDGTDTWYAYQPGTGQLHAIGPVHNYRYNSTGDFAILTINNVPGWNPKPWVYVHASSDTVGDPDYVITGDGGSTVGMRVCHTGANYPTDCDDVTAVGVDIPLFPDDLAMVNFCAFLGDSGGPVYSNGLGRGIFFGESPSSQNDCHEQLYQGVREAEIVLNVDVVGG